MNFTDYIDGLRDILDRIKYEQKQNIDRAGVLVADAIGAGGVIHTFGSGHSHLIADEAFFRAGGIAAINPILDERLIFLKGALESTRAERETGLARELIEKESVERGDVAIIISNSGRNAVSIEMTSEMRARGVKIIAITSLEQSRASTSRHPSGHRLFELADLVIDNCVPDGDALLSLPGLSATVGASSTVAGAAVINSIIIEAVSQLLKRGERVPVLTSANVEGTSLDTLREVLKRYRDRIRYLDLETEV
jgi:uncharacterized phosphosugar-binding protein